MKSVWISYKPSPKSQLYNLHMFLLGERGKQVYAKKGQSRKRGNCISLFSVYQCTDKFVSFYNVNPRSMLTSCSSCYQFILPKVCWSSKYSPKKFSFHDQSQWYGDAWSMSSAYIRQKNLARSCLHVWSAKMSKSTSLKIVSSC